MIACGRLAQPQHAGCCRQHLRRLLLLHHALPSEARAGRMRSSSSNGGDGGDGAAAAAPLNAATQPLQQPSAQSATTTSQKPRVIVVTGPTAVGKTAVGLELALRLGGEVISADSVQVYRGLDVGSDKVVLCCVVNMCLLCCVLCAARARLCGVFCARAAPTPHTATLQQPTKQQLPAAERRGVPHHLIDVRDVDGGDYSAGDF